MPVSRITSVHVAAASPDAELQRWALSRADFSVLATFAANPDLDAGVAAGCVAKLHGLGEHAWRALTGGQARSEALRVALLEGATATLATEIIGAAWVRTDQLAALLTLIAARDVPSALSGILERHGTGNSATFAELPAEVHAAAAQALSRWYSDTELHNWEAILGILLDAGDTVREHGGSWFAALGELPEDPAELRAGYDSTPVAVAACGEILAHPDSSPEHVGAALTMLPRMPASNTASPEMLRVAAAARHVAHHGAEGALTVARYEGAHPHPLTHLETAAFAELLDAASAKLYLNELAVRNHNGAETAYRGVLAARPEFLAGQNVGTAMRILGVKTNAAAIIAALLHASCGPHTAAAISLLDAGFSGTFDELAAVAAVTG